MLGRRHDESGRRSLFDAREIEELARKGRPRRRPGATELSIESAITALGRDRPYYRGRDAIVLAGSHSFEAVAEWLWTGEFPHVDPVWPPSTTGVAAARVAQAGLPADVPPIDRLRSS